MRFAHRLALQAKEVDVDGMLRRLSTEQFLRWCYYFQLEPPEDVRMDYRIASIRHAIYDLFRDRDKYPEPAPLEDYRLKWEEAGTKPKKKSWQQLLQIAKGIATIANRKAK